MVKRMVPAPRIRHHNAYPKEAPNNYLHRHAGEYQHPVNNFFHWIPAFAGMTTQQFLRLIHSFSKCSGIGKGLTLIFGLVLSASVLAGESETRLERILGELESYSAAFEQIRLNSAGETVETAIGVVYLQRPGRIHWAYWEPYVQLIISDGASVWIYEEDLEQVIIRDATDSIEDSPAAVLGGNVKIDEHYIVLELGGEEGADWLGLTPKDLDAQYESIRLGFVDKQLSGMVLQDGMGNRTNIRFLDTQRNPALAPELFRFTPPEGVDIIDNRVNQAGEAPVPE